MYHYPDFENADVKKMGRGKRSIWRCRSFRWLQRRWFHWVDRSFGSNLYWPGGCRKVGLPFFWHCSWIEEYNTIGSAWNITYIEQENTKKQNTEISPILSGRIQSASCFSMLPDVPNLWNVHFVILPSTFFIFVILFLLYLPPFLYICHPAQHKIII